MAENVCTDCMERTHRIVVIYKELQKWPNILSLYYGISWEVAVSYVIEALSERNVTQVYIVNGRTIHLTSLLVNGILSIMLGEIEVEE